MRRKRFLPVMEVLALVLFQSLKMPAAFSNHWEKGTAKCQSLGIAIRGAVVLCLLLAAPLLPAHPVSIITMEALAHRDRMELKIAVMPEDFLLVYGLY